MYGINRISNISMTVNRYPYKKDNGQNKKNRKVMESEKSNANDTFFRRGEGKWEFYV